MIAASLLSKWNLGLIVALGFFCVFLLWRLEVASSKTQELETNLAGFGSALSMANFQITETNKALDALAKSREVHDKKVLQITNNANSRINNLEQNKGREALVLAKPGLLENKINTSFNASQKLLSCVSGNIELCEKQ